MAREPNNTHNYYLICFNQQMTCVYTTRTVFAVLVLYTFRPYLWDFFYLNRWNVSDKNQMLTTIYTYMMVLISAQ